DYKEPSTTARNSLVVQAEHIELLDDDVPIAQSLECKPAVCDRWILAQRDQRLGNAAQFLRLGERRANGFVREERIGHVAQHRQAMRARAVQLSQAMAVTHVSSSIFTLKIVWLCQRFSRSHIHEK